MGDYKLVDCKLSDHRFRNHFIPHNFQHEEKLSGCREVLSVYSKHLQFSTEKYTLCIYTHCAHYLFIHTVYIYYYVYLLLLYLLLYNTIYLYTHYYIYTHSECVFFSWELKMFWINRKYLSTATEFFSELSTFGIF